MENRSCSDIIKRMISEIPDDQLPFIHSLQSNFEDSRYKAPEDKIQWFRVSETLQKFIPIPNKEWLFLFKSP